MGTEKALPQGHWFRKFGRRAILFIFSLIWRLEVIGAGNIPETGRAMLVGNHPSYLDPIGIWAVSGRCVRFMTWNAVFGIPVLKTLVEWAGCFPVDTDSFDPAAVRTAISVLKGDGVMGIFPEGERSYPDGTMRPFKKAAFRMAMDFSAPVIPVRTTGSSFVWPCGRRFPRLRGRITFEFLPAVDPSDFAGLHDPAQALMDEVRRIIEGKQGNQQMGGEDRMWSPSDRRKSAKPV